MLNILLDHPGLGLRILLENEFVDVSQISEELNASALV
jgi:hypothetical protein